jgi:hypothetical protein
MFKLGIARDGDTLKPIAGFIEDGKLKEMYVIACCLSEAL